MGTEGADDSHEHSKERSTGTETRSRAPTMSSEDRNTNKRQQWKRHKVERPNLGTLHRFPFSYKLISHAQRSVTGRGKSPI